ncbi:hypothetical protein Tco_0213978 [Tanacetum coccineum]
MKPGSSIECSRVVYPQRGCAGESIQSEDWSLNERNDLRVWKAKLGFNFFYSTTGTIDSIKSILTQSALDALCEKFYIPNIVHPELPGRNDRIRNSPTGYILEYFQINLSQLSVIAAAKVSHFKILCRVYSFVPTVEMDLFAFIHHADPTKLRIGEREVREGEVSLLELTRGRIVPLMVVNEQENQNEVVQDEGVRGIDIVADDETQAIIAEKPKKVRKKRKAVDGASGSGLPPKKLRENTCTLAVEVGATAAATVPFVTSSVTLTPKREDGGHADSITGPNLRTQLASKDGEANPDTTGPSHPAGTEVSSDTFFVVRDMDVETLQQMYAPKWTDLSSLHLSCDELSIKASSFEFEKEKLVDQVTKLKGTSSVLRDEVSGYTLFKEQVEVVQDEQVKALSGRVTGLDSDIIEMALHMDEEFYPCYLTTIAGQRWILGCGLKLVVMKCLQSHVYLAALGGAIGRAIEKSMQDRLAAGIDYGKTERGLVNIAAHNPSTEANYVSAINALRFVDFPFLAQLESQKDASMANIMDLLHSEGPAAETLEASQLQPSHEQLIIRRDVTALRLSLSEAMVPLIEPLSIENLVSEASTLGVPVAVSTTTSLSTTFVETSSVPPIPQTEAPPSSSIVFEKEELDTTPEAPYG